VVTDGVRAFIAGIRLLLDGARTLRRQRSLWGLAVVPVTVSLLAVGSAVALIYLNSAPIHELVTQWMPVIEVTDWIQWLWLGPAKFGFWLLGGLLFAIAAAVGVALAFVVATVVSAPFVDALSRRTELLISGGVVESSDSGWRAIVAEGRRSAIGELQRVGFLLLVWIVIGGAGFLIPGGQLVASPALVVFTVLFLPLDYASYTLDRRQIRFDRRRAWVRENLAMMAGFGTAAFASCLVPGLNFAMIPVFVVAGTLLVLRNPPTE
jgi:uncharacterized protein involved in cysteine biosynthesis